MKKILFAFFLTWYPFLLNAQTNHNLIGFKGGETGLISFIQHNMTYPANAREEGSNGIFFTLIHISKTGKIDSVSVLNGEQNIYFQNEILRTIKLSDTLWEKSKKNREIMLPIIFYFLDINKQSHGNNLIEIMPDIDNEMMGKFSAVKCIFLPPICIGGFGTKKY